MTTSPRTYVDSETHPIRKGHGAPRLAWLQHSAADGQFDGVTILERARALARWEELLRSEDTLVLHNGAFDLSVAANELGSRIVFEKYQRGQIEDTMINQRLIDIALEGQIDRYRYDVASCARRMGCAFIPNKEDPWRKRYGELEAVRPEDAPPDAVAYARGDIVVLEQLDAVQQEARELLINPSWYARNAFWLYLQTCTGMNTDRTQIDRYYARVWDRLQKDRRRLYDIGLIDHKGKRNTYAAKLLMMAACAPVTKTPPGVKPLEEIEGLQPGQLKALRAEIERAKAPRAIDESEVDPFADEAELAAQRADADELRRPALKYTKADGVGCDKDICAATGNEDLVAYAAYGSAGNRISRVNTLYELLIHPSYSYPMETGRTSSRGDGLLPGDQIQNPPKEAGYRECYIPPRGWGLCSVDMNSYELVGLAQRHLDRFGVSDLAERLKNGENPHEALAVDILREEFGEVTTIAEFKKARKDETNLTACKSYDYAKNCNFGLGGGMGAPKFSITAKISLSTAQVLKKLWMKADVATPQWIRWGSIESKYGDLTYRQPRSGRIRKLSEKRNYSQRLNSEFQGPCADAAMDAGWALTWACYLGEDLETRAPSILFGSRPVAFIHDEWLSIHPPPGVYNAASISDRCKEWARVQVKYAQPWFPDVPLGAEPAWGYRWCKKMDAVWQDGVKGGELLPWEPKGGWDEYLNRGDSDE